MQQLFAAVLWSFLLVLASGEGIRLTEGENFFAGRLVGRWTTTAATNSSHSSGSYVTVERNESTGRVLGWSIGVCTGAANDSGHCVALFPGDGAVATARPASEWGAVHWSSITNVTRNERANELARFRLSFKPATDAQGASEQGLLLHGERMGEGSQWMVFGFKRRAPFERQKLNNSSMFDSASPLGGRAPVWANATIGFEAFRHHQRAHYQNRTWWARHGVADDTRIFSSCFWIGVLIMKRKPLHGTLLHGAIHSTCNQTIFFENVTRTEFDREYVAVAPWVGLVLGAAGIVAEITLMFFVKNILQSQALTKRTSALTLWTLAHLTFMVAVAAITAASAIPLAAKALASSFFWWLGMVSCTRILAAVVKVRVEETPDSTVLQQLHRNGGLSMNCSMLVLLLLVQIFPAAVPFLALAGSLFLFTPQIWLNWTREDGLGLPPLMVWPLALSLSTAMLVCVAAPTSTLFNLTPSPRLGALAAALLLVQAALLELQRRWGAHALIPPCLRAQRHRYPISEHPEAAHAVAEDAECCVCHMPLAEGPAGSEAWVTPCAHVYHQHCLQQWMEERMECPICRRRLPQP